MNKRYIVITICIAILSLSCQNKQKENIEVENKKAETLETSSTLAEIPFTVVERYFVKNNAPAINHPKITSQEEFDQIFGAAAVMGKEGKPTLINFSEQYVIAVIKPETNLQTIMQSVTLKKENNGDIVFTYKFESGEKQSYTTQPFLAIIVDNSYEGEITLNEIQ